MKKRSADFSEISRRSMQKDFKRAQVYPREEKSREIDALPSQNAERRIIFVGENSSYFRLRSFLLGRAVRIIEPASVGGWICEFVNESDRTDINAAAGWSDRKRQYLFDCVKFK